MGGWRTLPARAFLRMMSWGYWLGNGSRSALYRLGILRPKRLRVPVISVGNLAVGGTGKSPMIAWLCDALLERGERVGVLARGYGAAGDGLNDEGLELEARFGSRIVQAQGPRRFNVGAALLDKHPDLTVLLLDDGFQHRALHRDLDMVLLEAGNPFGYGYLLPRGRLREPRTALARAHVVVLSKCEGIDAATLDRRTSEIRPSLEESTILARSELHVVRLETADGDESADRLIGKRVVIACGVGNPDHVRQTVASLGAVVQSMITVGDHRTIPQEELDRLLADVASGTIDGVVMTKKDAVKQAVIPPGVYVLSTEIRFSACVDAVMARVADALS